MDRTTLLWIALVAGALVTGGSIVGVLVLRRAAEPILGLGGLVAFAVSSSAFISLSAHYARADAVLYGFAFVVASVGGGYALASSLLDRLATRPRAVEPVRLDAAPSAGPAAVLVNCVEPAAYDPAATAAMLQSLTDEGLLDASMGALPFVFFAQKARYRAVGGASPAIGELSSLSERVAETLPGWSVTYAACNGPDRLPERVAALARSGRSPIVVAQVSIGQTGHMAEAKRQTDALHLDQCDVELSYTDGLADADRVGALVAGRIMRSVDDAAATGVVLVGHGQPEDRSRANPEFDEDENRFLNRVRLLLNERGLSEGNVRVAWMEWRSPNITSAVRHLAALGCRRVIVSPSCYALDTIATRLDMEIAVRQARVDESIAVVTLPAWRDDPLLVEELRTRITAAAVER